MSTRASAARYAKALLDVAIKESDPVLAERELAAFVALGQQHPQLQAALTHPAVPAAAKRAVVQQLLDRLEPVTPVGKLLLMLAERDRLPMLTDLLDVYRERLAEFQQVIRAEVTTAAPLAPERVTELQQRLAASTGKSVVLTARVDPAIIGGMVTRIGGTVFDGSVAHQLQTIRTRLSERF